MKLKLVALLLTVVTLFCMVSCGAENYPADSTEYESSTIHTENTEPDNNTEPDTTTAADVTTAKTDLPDGAKIPETIKILSIGNSFSTDCMEYLYQLLKNAGVKNVVLGIAYHSGCKLEQHLQYARADSTDYSYHKNTSGSWKNSANKKLSSIIADQDWDIITLQESSKTSGVANAYHVNLKPLVDIVRNYNNTAALVWNMTWAYQQDSTHSSFPTYNRNQMTMYQMILNCTKNYVEKDGRFEYIIPVGTSIQDARTSYLGDHITRDGYHLNKQFGRYLAALTWTCKILNIDPDAITYNPSPADINADMVRVAGESVRNALKTPYAVTESQIKEGQGSLAAGGTPIDPNEILNPEDYFETDKQVAAANGVNLDDFELLRWDYVENAYWGCTSRTYYTSPKSTSGTYQEDICSDRMFSVETELPIGSVFICDTGWQYRLEIHPSQTQVYSGTRPSLSSAAFFRLNEQFLNGCKFVAWNVTTSPKSNISEIYAQAAVHLRIYVPKT